MNCSLFITLTFTFLWLISSPAVADCTGFPHFDPHENFCPEKTTRKSCEQIPGCQWNSKPGVVKVCNKTNSKLALVTQQVSQQFNKIYESGWWILEAGQCFAFEVRSSHLFSYFAKSSPGHLYWYGNGEPICYDDSGKVFNDVRKLNGSSCGGENRTEMYAYRTIRVQRDDFIESSIEGPGANLAPGPDVSPFAAMAMSYCAGTSNFFFTNGFNSEKAKANVMKSCEFSCNRCQLGIVTPEGKPTCIAIVKGTEPFLAWGWSHGGKEDATNEALKRCKDKNQSCLIDYVACNDEVVSQ